MLSLDLALRRDDFALELACELGPGVTGLFGGSGAGKTTLLHLVAGLLRPDRGTVRLDDQRLVDTAQRLFVPPHRRRLGVVFQDARLFPHRSVRGNLRYGETHAAGEALAPFDMLVELLELGSLLDRKPQTLSGGEAQRVALGRALLAAPRLLLLDEPLAALDQRLRQQILPFLQRVRDQLALPMLYVSHDLGELLQLTEQLLVLDAGRVVGQGRYLDLVLDAGTPALGDQLLNVLRLEVRRHEDGGGMTCLAAPGDDGEDPCLLRAPLRDLATGSRVDVTLRPEDVALALAPVPNTSIQNQLRGTLRRVVPRAGQVVLEIDVGVPLLAEVTPRTVDSLQLRPGLELWCLIKSNAIKYL